jgi:hypothetical protein
LDLTAKTSGKATVKTEYTLSHKVLFTVLRAEGKVYVKTAHRYCEVSGPIFPAKSVNIVLEAIGAEKLGDLNTIKMDEGVVTPLLMIAATADTTQFTRARDLVAALEGMKRDLMLRNALWEIVSDGAQNMHPALRVLLCIIAHALPRHKCGEVEKKLADNSNDICNFIKQKTQPVLRKTGETKSPTEYVSGGYGLVQSVNAGAAPGTWPLLTLEVAAGDASVTLRCADYPPVSYQKGEKVSTAHVKDVVAHFGIDPSSLPDTVAAGVSSLHLLATLLRLGEGKDSPKGLTMGTPLPLPLLPATISPDKKGAKSPVAPKPESTPASPVAPKPRSTPASPVAPKPGSTPTSPVKQAVSPLLMPEPTPGSPPERTPAVPTDANFNAVLEDIKALANTAISTTGTISNGLWKLICDEKLSTVGRMVLGLLLRVMGANTKCTNIVTNAPKFHTEIINTLNKTPSEMLPWESKAGLYSIGDKKNKRTEPFLTIEKVEGELRIAHRSCGADAHANCVQTKLGTTRALDTLRIFGIATDDIPATSDGKCNVLHLLCILLSDP